MWCYQSYHIICLLTTEVAVSYLSYHSEKSYYQLLKIIEVCYIKYCPSV